MLRPLFRAPIYHVSASSFRSWKRNGGGGLLVYKLLIFHLQLVPVSLFTFVVYMVIQKSLPLLCEGANAGLRQREEAIFSAFFPLIII